MGWRDRESRRRRDDLWRTPPVITARGPGWIEHSGRRWTDFSSNDALGLGRRTLNLSAQAGAGASRLVTGNLEEIEQAEQRLADWCGFESALMFPSGWQANVAVCSGVFAQEDVVLSDERNHASLIDGLRLSRCRRLVLAHADPGALAKILDENEPVTGLVAESLYSVDGDFYPLADILRLLAGRETLVLVDEAHAAGLYGSRHQGFLEQGGGDDLVKVITLSKALGVQGGAVLCTRRMRGHLVNMCRGFVYSTGVSPLLAAAVTTNLESLQHEDLGHKHLFALSHLLYDTLLSGGLKPRNHRGAHILTVDYPNHDTGRQARDRLLAADCWPAWLRWPTVPEGTSRLRLSLTVDHNEDDIRKAAKALLPLS